MIRAAALLIASAVLAAPPPPSPPPVDLPDAVLRDKIRGGNRIARVRKAPSGDSLAGSR
jgi:hypothetical protein